LLLAVEITSLLKKRISTRFWHGVHLLGYALYAVATIHLLTAGSNRDNPLLRCSVPVSVGVVVFFTIDRAWSRRECEIGKEIRSGRCTNGISNAD